MEFYVFRHGQTDNNIKKIWQGCRVNSELNNVGLQQAHDLAQRMLSKNLEIIFSSPLVRACTTGKIVAETCHIPFEIRDNLHEADYGLADGQTYNYIESHWPDILKRWREPDCHDFDIRFDEGESQQEVLARIFAVLEDIASLNRYHTVGISVHGGTIGLLMSALGVEKPQIANGGHIHLQRLGKNSYKLLKD